MKIIQIPSNVCRCCSKQANRIFNGLLLGDSVDYFECPACGYVQTEFPYWLEKAYSSTINNCDTGIMVRNQVNLGLVLATLTTLRQINGRVVDYAGGYGILVRLLRDRGVDALWSDPYCKNLLAVGFEHTEGQADLVTAFEAFEHFVNPILECEKLFAIAPNLLISTTLMEKPPPNPTDWWYYGLNHGQHIGFFRLQTLQYIAEKFGKHLFTNGTDCHLFTSERLSSMQWNLSLRIARRLPSVYGRKLESKVWNDFEKMSGK